MDDTKARQTSVEADEATARLRAMRLLPVLLALCTALSACGADDAHVSALHADASVDGSGSKTDAMLGGDGLLADASDAGCMSCTGASMPTWQLVDVQPKSPGYGKTYGLEAFKGKVTVVALLASW